MILPDTSAWVEYLRRGEKGPAAALGDLAARREVVVCGPVTAELIAGTSARDRERVTNVLDGLAWVELGRAEWIRAGELAGALQREGKTVPLTDIAIATAALRAGATVWTSDADFERIAEAAPDLQLRSL